MRKEGNTRKQKLWDHGERRLMALGNGTGIEAALCLRASTPRSRHLIDSQGTAVLVLLVPSLSASRALRFRYPKWILGPTLFAPLRVCAPRKLSSLLQRQAKTLELPPCGAGGDFPLTWQEPQAQRRRELFGVFFSRGAARRKILCLYMFLAWPPLAPPRARGERVGEKEREIRELTVAN